MHTIIPDLTRVDDFFSIYFNLMLQAEKKTAADYARELGYSPRAAQHWAKGETTPPLQVVGDVIQFATECRIPHHKGTKFYTIKKESACA